MRLKHTLVILAIASLTPLAHATMVRPRTLEELSREAEEVVVARVLGQAARMDPTRRIRTEVILEVEMVLPGHSEGSRSSEQGEQVVAAGEELTLITWGGVVGDLGMRVEGEPALERGARYLLFLRPFEDGFRPVGMSQGVMKIEREGERDIVHPGGAGLSFSQDGITQRTNPIWRPRSLSAILREVANYRTDPAVTNPATPNSAME